MLYDYEAWNEDGKAVQGSIEADDLQEAQARLKSKNLSITTLRPQRNFVESIRLLLVQVALLVASGGLAFSIMSSQGVPNIASIVIGCGVGVLSICFTTLSQR